MSNRPPDPVTPLGDALSGLPGVSPSSPHAEPGTDEYLPEWDVPMAIPVADPTSGEVPMALPVLGDDTVPLASLAEPDLVPMATLAEEEPVEELLPATDSDLLIPPSRPRRRPPAPLAPRRTPAGSRTAPTAGTPSP